MSAKSRRSTGNGTPDWAVRLGGEVRQRRKALRLTQQALAELAKCGPDFLYDLERGKPTIRLDKLVPVLETLGLTFELVPRSASAP
ncbi:MAG: helix-turn-helix domain-containing protein [Myxococcaceae bacterium]|nr:helix-turn-helix domain-containing protein [Myxococcaceae bacterium]